MASLEAILKDNEKVQHIINVIEERVLLYDKRRIETRRALKAMQRAQILPEPYQVFIILEAEIICYLNQAAKKALMEISASISSKKSITLKNFNTLFKRKLSETNFSRFDLQLKAKDISEFRKIIFSLNDDYQKEKIAMFLLIYNKKILERIFQELVIFDEGYVKKVIKEQKKYLKEKKSIIN